VAESPKSRGRCQILQRCERALNAMRVKAFTGRHFDRLARTFEERVGTPEIERVGVLLVSAVADEAAGIEHAVTALTSFVCDRSRFAASWVAAAEDIVAEARSAVRQ
jgi:hypothetical protein